MLELSFNGYCFSAGQGFQHFSLTLNTFVARTFDPTDASFTVGLAW